MIYEHFKNKLCKVYLYLFPLKKKDKKTDDPMCCTNQLLGESPVISSFTTYWNWHQVFPCQHLCHFVAHFWSYHRRTLTRLLMFFPCETLLRGNWNTESLSECMYTCMCMCQQTVLEHWTCPVKKDRSSYFC